MNADRPSMLLPSGASLSVIAALIEGLGKAPIQALALALIGGISAIGAWILAVQTRVPGPQALGVRFLSILAIAFAISSLFVDVQTRWLASVGLLGLWLAALGAGIEWLRGRTLDLGPRES